MKYDTDDEFEYKQSKTKASIRIKERRGFPIDHLLQSLILLKDTNRNLQSNPSTENKKFSSCYFEDDFIGAMKNLRLPMDVLGELRGEDALEIQKISSLEYPEFWECILVYLNEKFRLYSSNTTSPSVMSVNDSSKLRLSKQHPPLSSTEEGEEDYIGIHKDIADETVESIRKKSLDELKQFEGDLRSIMDNAIKYPSHAAVDLDFYEFVLRKVRYYKALAMLNQYHQKMVHLLDEILEEHQRCIMQQQQQQQQLFAIDSASADLLVEDDVCAMINTEDEDLLKLQSTASAALKQLPITIPSLEATTTSVVVTAAAAADHNVNNNNNNNKNDNNNNNNRGNGRQNNNIANNALMINNVRTGGNNSNKGSGRKSMYDYFNDRLSEYEMVHLAMQNSSGPGDFKFFNEVPIWTVLGEWSLQMTPIKPRYYNYVSYRYDFGKHRAGSKYSDRDQKGLTKSRTQLPPLKYVSGYKFHIFYPDLLDKSKTPEFFLDKEPDSSEVCTLRFRAGPPYRDIAFRIANREWEMGHKYGFKSEFERGVMLLHFTFKRHTRQG